MHFIILKFNVHKIKLNQDSKMANFNYKVQNFRLMYNMTVQLCNMLNEYHCPVYLPT